MLFKAFMNINYKLIARTVYIPLNTPPTATTAIKQIKYQRYPSIRAGNIPI